MKFSLFFFSANGSKTRESIYRLLFDSVAFADTAGFHAVWTPERHFHEFGGPYPSPAVLSAAIAMVTKRLRIRAGSVVLPLHHPIRVAEEWSVLDHLSQGRIGVAFASGWQPNDFVLAPEAFGQHKELMWRQIQTVRRLWAGERVAFRGGGKSTVEIEILPKPIQDELPIWIATAGNPQTWIQAGAIGANVLSALLGQTVEELEQKITLYRESRARNGHDPRGGEVTLMLHAFVGEEMERVKETVRLPFSNYLLTHLDLYDTLARGQNIDVDKITAADKDTLVAFAFERYFSTSALFGTPDTCRRQLDHFQTIGVDEVACLIDFGVDAPSVMESLHLLSDVQQQWSAQPR